ncbi:DUF2971 domain-containing protein [Magnetovibrio sp. PR-2]|uniref:DUF2971 domain-containing protein n=1 Tax=Magnetovibrio sp. PR-2 TaxID=3120356 RepID=UPI002FCDFD36
MSEQNILWHYCSNTAFKSIVETQELLLNEISESNDYMEGKWLLEHVLRDALLECGISSLDASEFLKKIYSIKERYNAFAFCLSEEPDLLSQWRGYADDGHGVAIGFNKTFLEGLLGGNGPNLLSQVMYTKNDQLNLIGGNDEIMKIKDCLERGALLHGHDLGGLLTGPPTKEEKEKREAAFNDMFTSVFRLAAMSFQAKNPAFGEEKEWRLIQHNFKKSQTGLEALAGDYDYYDPNRQDITLRASREKITPSIQCKLPLAEMPLARALLPAIQEVKLGPKNLTDIKTIKFLVAKNKMGAPKITRSDATYR